MTKAGYIKILEPTEFRIQHQKGTENKQLIHKIQWKTTVPESLSQ